MKVGNILLKNLTGFIIAAVFFAGCLCMGLVSEAGYSPKNWYDKDGLFHEQYNSYHYAKDERGLLSKQVEVVMHTWYDREWAVLISLILFPELLRITAIMCSKM